MDHLKTSEERRERWYSKLAPRYVSIKNPSCAQDVLLSSSKEEDEIYGIPFTLLKDHPNLLSNTIEKHGFAIVSGVLSEDDAGSHWKRHGTISKLRAMRKKEYNIQTKFPTFQRCHHQFNEVIHCLIHPNTFHIH